VSESGGLSDAAVGTVVVRSRWNGVETLAIPISVLHQWHVRDAAGGVCRAAPRGFLHAHLWCDHANAAALGHVCGPDAPHDLLVCILPTDNAALAYARAAALARGGGAR